MRTTLIGASFLVFGAGAAVVGAGDNVALQGSDTLEHFTNHVLANCPNAVAANITYRGGGSTTGGNAMIAGTQQVSPQSRALSTAEGCAKNSGTTAEGFVIALDGLSVMARTGTATACGGELSANGSFTVTDAGGNPVVSCPGCTGSQYTFSDWRDVLALIYAGKHHDATGTRDCDSRVRHTLVNNFGRLFKTGCSGGICPAGLQRAFRRADLSGTTDTFLSLVGLSSMPLARGVPGASAKTIDFCNARAAGALFGGGSDYLDLDPVRRDCAPQEQVCGVGRGGPKNLGLVTVIEIPANRTTEENYPTQLCSFGAFEFNTMTLPFGQTTCPNGRPSLLNRCFTPVLRDPSQPNGFTAHCIARSFPVQAIDANGMDGRAYNQWQRNAAGQLQRDNLNRFIIGAFYRIHTTTTIAAGASVCRENSATAQIGCLTQANPCSIGWAGREGVDVVPGAISALAVNGLMPTVPNIEALVRTPGNPADDYVLSRKLYFDTLIGFEATTGGERELSTCMADDAKASAAAIANNFVPVPADVGGVICEDFDETRCGAASNTDACAGNPF